MLEGHRPGARLGEGALERFQGGLGGGAAEAGVEGAGDLDSSVSDRACEALCSGKVEDPVEVSVEAGRIALEQRNPRLD